MGRRFWFVAVPLDHRFGPRTLTHPAVMLLAVAVLAAPLGLVQSLYDGAVGGGYESSRRGKSGGRCSGGCSMAKDGKRSRRPPESGGDAAALEAFIGGAE